MFGYDTVTTTVTTVANSVIIKPANAFGSFIEGATECGSKVGDMIKTTINEKHEMFMSKAAKKDRYNSAITALLESNKANWKAFKKTFKVEIDIASYTEKYNPDLYAETYAKLPEEQLNAIKNPQKEEKKEQKTSKPTASAPQVQEDNNK